MREASLAESLAADFGIHAIMTKDFSFDEVEEIGDVIRNGLIVGIIVFARGPYAGNHFGSPTTSPSKA